MSNYYCRMALCSGYQNERKTLMHTGQTGMHWGYRYHQPYSAGYDAQNKGIYLGQTIDKLNYAKNWTKFFAKGLASEAKKSVKSKFDKWNNIDTSRTMAEAMQLMRESNSNLQRAGAYREKLDTAMARAHHEKYKNDVTSQIVETLSNLNDTYRARARQGARKGNELYEQAKLDTKTKRIAAKMRKLMGYGSKKVSDIPDWVSQMKLTKKTAMNQDISDALLASKDVSSMLSKLAGLNEKQTVMTTGDLADWFGFLRGRGVSRSDPRQRAIDEALEDRRKKGYSSMGRDKLEQIVKLAYGGRTGNELITDPNLIPKSQRLWE